MSDSPRQSASVPRGRHAPPLEVRLGVQRERLFEAAAREFASVGFAEATAESISRAAGMSKATFYEHFANKEECLLALFDEAAKLVLGRMGEASESTFPTYEARVENGVRLFLETLTAFPDAAQTLLVQVIAAGPRAAERRDRVMEAFAEFLESDNRRHGDRFFASRDDAYAIVGAIVELVTRQMRTGTPADVRELEPVIERLIFGLLTAAQR
jgi:AcrR family transcriptional regulator